MLLAAGLCAPATAALAATPEPATVSLPACASDAPFSDKRTADCTYIAMTATSGQVMYGHVTSAGEVIWTGTDTGGALSFPSTAQTWPVLSLYGGLGNGRITPATITGTLAASGEVAMQIAFDVRISALGQQCQARGVIAVSSTATDTIGGGQGSNRDATGRFAVAGTSLGAPELSGSACAQAAQYLDLGKGVGVFVAGTLSVGSSDSGATAGAQTAVLRTPARLKPAGRTVLLPHAVTTNAGQKASVSVRWSVRKAADGTSPRYARLRVGREGAVSLITTGKAKRLYVRMTVSAPATASHGEYLQTRRWVVR